MVFWSERELGFLHSVSQIAFGNPFLPELARHEEAALGNQYVPEPPFWSLEVRDPGKRRENTWRIVEPTEALLEAARVRFQGGARPDFDSARLYEDAALYAGYHRFYDRFSSLTDAATGVRAPFYDEFLEWWETNLRPGFFLPSAGLPGHTFAAFFQIVRAFRNIFESIIGGSGPAGRLRAAVWQSIFTHDMRRYRRTFYSRMGEFVTLVTGPSGSGKELVARAVALSRYLPFDERSRTFPHSGAGLFHPVHIAALSPSLLESELFGHRKGSFTGAVRDRRGHLEACPPEGAVFLDEIGELAPDIQVKLLRVIETREFTAVGDVEARRFGGKLIAATHRDLPGMVERGQFREDLYYRLCSDLVETPSLREQLADSPEALPDLVRYMAVRHAGAEADAVAEEALGWIRSRLGERYEWPGNYRELEQCVRNFIVRREYRPARRAAAADIFDAAREVELTADELLSRYCTLAYARTGSYEAAARKLALDRRTVQRRVDRALLERLGGRARG